MTMDLPPDQPLPDETPTHGERIARPMGLPPRWARGLVAGGIAAFFALVGMYVRSVKQPVTIAGLKVGEQPIGGVPFSELEARIGPALEKYLDGKLTLVFGKDEVRATRREVGFTVDRAAVLADVRAAGKHGNPLTDLAARSRARRGKLDLDVAVEVDRVKALEFLTELKDDLDRGAVDARLDLERHTIAPEVPGQLLRVYDSMVALEYAAQSGSSKVELKAALTPARTGAKDLEGIDISTVLGNWETRYSASAIDSDRTYNLKVGADHLNGHILRPHEVFSFNAVVGDRTEKEGYRVAPVISGGELIDGLAGGMCQIASTLHAAAFFAGLEVVSSTPHSRPSAYIPMGLDSTVVYPTTDLKLRNPYEFPVVMHYQVNQGSVKVELLGKERPYKVIFEREIKTESAFGTETRADLEAPEGQKITLQEGYPGYSLIRRRYLFDKDDVPKWGGVEPLADLLKKQKKQPLAKQQWALKYPATTNIVAVGAGAATLKQKPQPPAHKIPPVNPKDKPIFKMLR
jgi:vancomycin resistance protein YoaR